MISPLKRISYFLFAVPLAMWPKVEYAASIAWRMPWILLVAPKVWAKVFVSQDEALKKAFPPPVEVRRKTLFLTEDQALQIETLARAKMTSRVVTYYEGWLDGKLIGTAFFDTQVVRTMPMTFMTRIQPDGTLAFVEILSFYEPEDYLPRARWLQAFEGKRLDEKLRLRWGIPNVTGSSLTCHTLTDGVRRLLATHQVGVQRPTS